MPTLMDSFLSLGVCFAAQLKQPTRARWCVRFQVQTGKETLASAGVECPSPTGGVTLSQARKGLERCNVQLQSDHPKVHAAAQTAMACMAEKLATFPPGGVSRGNFNFARREVVCGRRLHCVDAENMVGHNLKS